MMLCRPRVFAVEMNPSFEVVHPNHKEKLIYYSGKAWYDSQYKVEQRAEKFIIRRILFIIC